MSDKPNYRHSFLNPTRTEADKLSVNRFGHTILGGQLDENVLSHDEMDVSVDPSGDIVANRKTEIFEHPAVRQWAVNAGIDPSVFMEDSEQEPKPNEADTSEPLEDLPQSLFDRLPTNLDEMLRESHRLQSDNPINALPNPPRLNRSSPQEVQITLPARMDSVPPSAAPAAHPEPMRCKGCHGSHPANARFCPHCGMALTRFCIECGYQFEGSERFCPDCGTRR